MERLLHTHCYDTAQGAASIDYAPCLTLNDIKMVYADNTRKLARGIVADVSGFFFPRLGTVMVLRLNGFYYTSESAAEPDSIFGATCLLDQQLVSQGQNYATYVGLCQVGESMTIGQVQVQAADDVLVITAQVLE